MTIADSPDITPEEFVHVIFRDVFQAAERNVFTALADPPGRAPRERLVAMHEWFENLTEPDRDMLREVVRYAADHAVFGFLCILDSVMPVSSGYRETLRLKVRSDSVERDLAPEGVELHTLFRGMVDSESGWDTE